MQDGLPDPGIPLYRFHAHTGRWQALAFQVMAEPDLETVVAAVRQAIGDAPQEGTVGDRLVARSVLNEIVARLVRRVGLERDPDVNGALLALLTSCRSEDWSRQALALLDHCALPNAPLLVRRALRMLDERYRDSQLDQAGLAGALGVSAGYLHRLLKAHTGLSFLQHVHGRRTAEACRLIRETRDTFDAIALQVGYSDERQLRRHLVRERGITPRALRAVASAAPTGTAADTQPWYPLHQRPPHQRCFR